MTAERFQQALDAIDRANAADPHRIDHGGASRPKELVHGELVSRWIERLSPRASEALQLAGRAHHLERWAIPRASHPDGRDGYLAWRRTLQDHHVARAREILSPLGYDESTLGRVEEILRKRRLQRDPEVQCFEDALCLVFLETQLTALAGRMGDPKMIEILRRTLPKMSDKAKQEALALALRPEDRALLEKALEAR